MLKPQGPRLFAITYSATSNETSIAARSTIVLNQWPRSLAATAQSRGLKTLWALIHRSLHQSTYCALHSSYCQRRRPHGNETAKSYRELKTKPYTIGNRYKKIVARYCSAYNAMNGCELPANLVPLHTSSFALAGKCSGRRERIKSVVVSFQCLGFMNHRPSIALNEELLFISISSTAKFFQLL
ncbi:uncharacterized protein P174DRAFT_49654 [Aspergillus novofumigatus IBT 16806]|uniref:Uncharacterized protein n=1 Tax=Aspergillus novofumigatus (strain IBT 16806) TaxID=1392255 RepID=A0A2I1CPE4_ASPN1|nr:uncharacterized protein P174DRAFT_49654 [Aspergillus novofumigatus IBT 16806]PKX99504.1 hypothetical protein P174DRAFT_49654 [Aspergillus novofumigatus IBT 16806]